MKFYYKKIQNGFSIIIVYRDKKKYKITEWIAKPKTFTTAFFEAEEFENKNGEEITQHRFNSLYQEINRERKFTNRKLKV
jgi:hypothetical protein